MKRTEVAAWILAESVSAQMTVNFATQARAGLFWMWKQYWSLLVDTLPKSGIVLGKQEGRSPWPLPGLRPCPGLASGSVLPLPQILETRDLRLGEGRRGLRTALCPHWAHGFPPEVCLRGQKDFLWVTGQMPHS